MLRMPRSTGKLQSAYVTACAIYGDMHGLVDSQACLARTGRGTTRPSLAVCFVAKLKTL
jgi:hypothetical protein